MSVVASGRPDSAAAPVSVSVPYHNAISQKPHPSRYRRSHQPQQQSQHSPYAVNPCSSSFASSNPRPIPYSHPHPRPSSSTSSLNTNFSVSSAPAGSSYYHHQHHHHPSSPSIHSPFSPSFPYLPYSSASSLPYYVTPESPLRQLPQQVYDAILDQLEFLHVGPRQWGCLTCFRRDLHALSLTCRSWEKAVRARLYNRIHIIGNDSPAQLKKYRMKRGSRLKLLRRTLRERKLLANLVLELRVPQMDTLMAKSAQWEEYRDLVASVVMVCPNLERLLGLSIPYNHEFDRLTYALSKRKKLKEHTWILGEAPEVSEGSPRCSSCPGSLGPLQMFEFLNYHVSWTNLETLMLYASSEKSALEPSIFLRMFNLLPALRNLCVSSFNANAFDDNTLVCLPPLESLRLENLPGVTDAGLSQYSSCSEARSLKSLTLIEQNIDSLLVISKLFASLGELERFTIVQTSKCPSLSHGEIVIQPLLASSSLQYLHWDVSSPQSTIALSKFDSTSLHRKSQLTRPSSTPNSHLSQSILAAGFPRLKALRAPSDIEPLGALQAVCQPIPNGQALIPSDRYSLPRSSHGSVNARRPALPSGNNLTSARIRAQTLIELASKDTESGMKFVITDYSDSYIPDNASDDASSIEEDDDSDGGSEEQDVEMDEFRNFASRRGSSKGGGGDYNDNSNNNSNNNDYNNNNNDDDLRHEEIDGPVTLHEFRLPAYMGRVGTKDSTQNISIPRFILHPDISGADADGGLVGWRHLLTSNQSLSYAAGVGTNTFSTNNRSITNLSPVEEPAPISPSSSTTPSSSSRFAWSNIGSNSRSTMASSPSNTSASTSTSMSTSMSMSTPSTPLSLSSPVVPPWDRDTCTGAWNCRHKGGKDWWFHVERDRPGSVELIDLWQLF